MNIVVSTVREHRDEACIQEKITPLSGQRRMSAKTMNSEAASSEGGRVRLDPQDQVTLHSRGKAGT